MFEPMSGGCRHTQALGGCGHVIALGRISAWQEQSWGSGCPGGCRHLDAQVGAFIEVH